MGVAPRLLATERRTTGKHLFSVHLSKPYQDSVGGVQKLRFKTLQQ